MRVLLLSDASSPHTIKWATSLAASGIDIGIITLSAYNETVYAPYKTIKIFPVVFENDLIKTADGSIQKLKYVFALQKIKAVIKKFQPDILHAHYATSYGLLGALCRFHPYMISVWGSDVFDFPKVSFLHKKILQYNLSCADSILSTSEIMKKETLLYTNKEISVVPFGIDLNVFKPMKVDSLFDEGSIVIGTVKTLEKKYGIEYLIKGFALLKNRIKSDNLKLLIVGGGSQEAYLKELVHTLNIDDMTIFTGRVPYKDVPKYQNMLSISVSVSVLDSESFGVAVLEASACEKPVIVANVGGLPEVVEDNITGIIVPKKDEKKTADAIEKLIVNQELLNKMGRQGRKHVGEFYSWENNLKTMIDVYKNIERNNK